MFEHQISALVSAVQQLAAAEERERWRELVEQLIACHEDRSCPAVDWARDMLAGNDRLHGAQTSRDWLRSYIIATVRSAHRDGHLSD